MNSIAEAPPPEMSEPPRTLEKPDKTARKKADKRTPVQKMSDADNVLADDARGESTCPDKIKWARAYIQSSEYRTEKILAVHFQKKTTTPSSTQKATRKNAG